MLGRTGLGVGVIGLGTEYLIEVSRETVVSTVRAAVEAGVNYFDVTFAFPEYRDNFGAAFDGLRDDVIITGHLGPAVSDGQMAFTRDLAECERYFDDLLERLHTDHVDVVFLSTVDAVSDYEETMADGGRLELALRYKAEGKARFIGLSGHSVDVASAALDSEHVDVIMQAVNMTGHGTAGKDELCFACAESDVALVGMKPFAGGELLRRGEPSGITPVQCLSYALSRPGVPTVVPGVNGVEELQATLAYLDATPEERDFSGVLQQVAGTERGTCTYCNHCLPCPVGINVGQTLRVLATAREVGPAAAPAVCGELRDVPECTACGVCMERCPFDVDVVSQMEELTRLFEG